VTIRYAAAFEIPGAGDKLPSVEDALLDLLASPKSGGGRWQVFDTSEKRGGVFRLALGSKVVPPGVDIGLHGMCQGERRVLYVPAQLAYADRGSKAFGVPPNAALRYDVELEGVVQMGRRTPLVAGGRRQAVGGRQVPGRLVE